MSDVVLFDFDGCEIRVAQIDGEPWFVARDVCDVLGLSRHRDAVSRLDDDERGSVLVDTLGGAQETSSVNEYGLYNLIMTSRKEKAKSFKRWVTHEVLPEIRKTGGYIHATPEMSDEDILARAVLVANAKIKDREEQLALAESERDEAIAKKAVINGRQMATALGKLGGTTRSLNVVRAFNDEMVPDVVKTISGCMGRVIKSIEEDALEAGIPMNDLYKYGWRAFYKASGTDRIRPPKGNGSFMQRILLTLKVNARIEVRDLALEWDRRKNQKGFRSELLASLSKVMMSDLVR